MRFIWRMFAHEHKPMVHMPRFGTLCKRCHKLIYKQGYREPWVLAPEDWCWKCTGDGYTNRCAGEKCNRCNGSGKEPHGGSTN